MIPLGRMTLNEDNAILQAIQSTLSPVSSIHEIIQNPIDWGAKNIDIRLYGKNVINAAGKQMILVTSVSVEDDGVGMNHDRVINGFGQVYGNSSSHDAEKQSGRNGIGVKTCLNYFSTIKLQTTTNGIIDSDFPIKNVSSLKAGDKDTELRKYKINIREISIDDPWEKIDHNIHKTIVTLEDPQNKYIEIVLDELIRKISHNIAFLENKDEHIVTIHYSHITTQNATSIRVFPMKNESSHDCHLVGNSKKDSYLIFPSLMIEPIKIPACMDPLVENVSYDIKFLRNGPGDFVVSVCGASIYEDDTFSHSTINKIISLSKSNFTSVSGFSSRLFGHIICNSTKLKRELRHNKSALDEHGKYSKAFIDYISWILKKINELYDLQLNSTNSEKEIQLLEDVSKDLNLILNQSAHPPSSKPINQSTITYHHWHCNSCDLDWKTQKEKQPTYCAQHNVDKEAGCNSTNIERNKSEKTSYDSKRVKTEFKDFLGNFIPAIYEESSNTVFISKFHPHFVTLKDDSIRKAVMIEKSLHAIAMFKIASSLPNHLDVLSKFEQSYGNFLKEHYATRLKSFQRQCRSIWKKNNIEFESI